MKSDRKFILHNGQSGAAITVRVTPKASQNEISEIMNDGTVKVRLTSPLDDVKTNQALVAFLAEVLEIAPSQLDIVAGHADKDKLITVLNLDTNIVQERILKHLA
ncbi:MAG: DUF167 domain-containing protein [Anaerolineaceae bacterium]|nr:DUF167 domain-containing protein [Anaerolineaceae bacterium]